MPRMYYHVMYKDEAWHLYFGNASAPVLVCADRRKVLDAARKLARQNGMKIVIHNAGKPAASADDERKGD